MKLENYDEFIEYVLDEFEMEDDITVICDYKLADILNYYFGDEEYCEYKGIDLQSDVNEYYVTKFGNECFCIEPLKFDNKIKMTTGDYFIINSDILEDNPTLFNYLEGNHFKVEIIDYENCENKISEEDLLQLTGLICEYSQLILDNEYNEKTIAHALTEFTSKVLKGNLLK